MRETSKAMHESLISVATNKLPPPVCFFMSVESETSRFNSFRYTCCCWTRIRMGSTAKELIDGVVLSGLFIQVIGVATYTCMGHLSITCEWGRWGKYCTWCWTRIVWSSEDGTVQKTRITDDHVEPKNTQRVGREPIPPLSFVSTRMGVSSGLRISRRTPPTARAHPPVVGLCTCFFFRATLPRRVEATSLFGSTYLQDEQTLPFPIFKASLYARATRTALSYRLRALGLSHLPTTSTVPVGYAQRGSHTNPPRVITATHIIKNVNLQWAYNEEKGGNLACRAAFERVWASFRGIVRENERDTPASVTRTA